MHKRWLTYELCPPYPFKMKLLILRRIAWRFMAKTWWPAKRWASIVMPCKGCLPLLKDSVLLIVKEPKRTAATVSNILPWFISQSGQFPFSQSDRLHKPWQIQYLTIDYKAGVSWKTWENNVMYELQFSGRFYSHFITGRARSYSC